MVFLVAGLVLICVFGLIMLEKVKFLPKQILSISAYASNNKVMHQILAATNVLSLFACVLMPLVSPQKFRYYCAGHWGNFLPFKATKRPLAGKKGGTLPLPNYGSMKTSLFVQYTPSGFHQLRLMEPLCLVRYTRRYPRFCMNVLSFRAIEGHHVSSKSHSRVRDLN